MENKTQLTIGALLTASLLISLGFNISDNDTHVCRELSLAKDCARLSSTGNTCYPLESSNVGQKYCASGWEAISQDIAQITDETQTEQPQQFSCGVGYCEKIR